LDIVFLVLVTLRDLPRLKKRAKINSYITLRFFGGIFLELGI